MLSASSVPRALRCVASLVLPRRRFDREFADAGSEYHEEIESAIDTGDEDAIPEAVLALINEGDECITERAFAYNVATDTARDLAAASHRDYSDVRPFEIPGTPDLVIRHANGRVTVVDHKSFLDGSMDQLATYALMVSRAWGVDEIECVIHYKAAWKRPLRVTLGPLDLDAHAAKLKQLQLDAAKAQVNPLEWVRKGDHCSYCDCWADCPAWEGLRGQVRTGELALTVETMVSDEDGAALWEMRDQLKTMLSRVTSVCYARAKERPIPLPDGNMLAYVEKQGKRKIDGNKAYALIKERFGTQVADDSVRRTVAQSWIKEALKKHGVKGVDKRNAEIVKALEDAGAVTRETKLAPEVVPAVKLLKESA